MISYELRTTGGSYAKIRAGNLRPDAHRQRAGIVSCISSPDASLTAIGLVRQQRAQDGGGAQEVLHSNVFTLSAVCPLWASAHAERFPRISDEHSSPGQYNPDLRKNALVEM